VARNTERYDDVASLLEEAGLDRVHYQEFGRHARRAAEPEPYADPERPAPEATTQRPPQTPPAFTETRQAAPDTHTTAREPERRPADASPPPQPTAPRSTETTLPPPAPKTMAGDPERQAADPGPAQRSAGPAAAGEERSAGARRLRPVFGNAGAQPSGGESLQATFSRLVARAPEPKALRLDLGLDLPVREPAPEALARKDERLGSLFSRLKAHRNGGTGRD